MTPALLHRQWGTIGSSAKQHYSPGTPDGLTHKHHQQEFNPKTIFQQRGNSSLSGFSSKVDHFHPFYFFFYCHYSNLDGCRADSSGHLRANIVFGAPLRV